MYDILFTYIFLFSVEQVRVGPPQPKITRSSKPKVFVTNGRDIPLRGICLVFTKVEPGTQITEANISKVSRRT